MYKELEQANEVLMQTFKFPESTNLLDKCNETSSYHITKHTATNNENAYITAVTLMLSMLDKNLSRQLSEILFFFVFPRKI